MRARFIEIYLLPSLTSVIDIDPLILIDTPGRRAYVGKTDEEAILHLRRRNAAGAMLAQSVVGRSRADQPARVRFEAIFAGQGGQMAASGNAALLVVDCERNRPDDALQNVIDLDDFAVSLVSTADNLLADQARSLRNAALSALALAGAASVTDDARCLGSVDIVYEAGTGRPVYVIAPTGSVTMSFRSSMSAAEAAEAVALTTAFVNSPKNLRHVPRLLAQSHEDRLRPLSAFISAWAALEMLIVSTFSHYEAAWATTLEAVLPGGTSSAIARIRTVMKDKYRLIDKFAVIASALDPDGAEKDILSFTEVKAIRDGFFHTLATDPSDLPAESVRRLLRKYLSLHLKRNLPG